MIAFSTINQVKHNPDKQIETVLRMSDNAINKAFKAVVDATEEAVLNSMLFSEVCEMYKPEFHTDEYFEQMKRRLYTKDKEHYSYWSELGESNENWYWVDNQWKKYVNGKIIK